MKKKIQILSLISMVFFFCSLAVSAQTRITFRPGATSTTVTGRLTGFRSVRNYVIRVRRGQTLRVEQIREDSRRTTITISDPDGEDASDMDASCNNQKRVDPTKKGDYRINVRECIKADPWRGTFTLRIRVTG
jgi:hypothetical protein